MSPKTNQPVGIFNVSKDVFFKRERKRVIKITGVEEIMGKRKKKKERKVKREERKKGRVRERRKKIKSTDRI